MTTNIRRFAAAVSLAFVLSATPVVAAPSRDGDPGRDRTSIVRVVKRLFQRFFGVTPTMAPIGPIPAPGTPTSNP